MNDKKPGSEKTIESDDLLKAVKDIENEILSKALGGDDESESDETGTEDESASEIKKSAASANEPVQTKGAKEAQASTQEEADGNGSELNPGGERLKADGGKLAKGFADTATPEAQAGIDGVPFLMALAESQDTVAAAVNEIKKSLGGTESRNAVLAKGFIALGRELIEQRSVNSELIKSLNEIKAAIKLPVRPAPKSVLSKSEVAERFDGDTKTPAEAAAGEKRTLSKSQTSRILADLVLKGEVDALDAITYEGTGELSASANLALVKHLKDRK